MCVCVHRWNFGLNMKFTHYYGKALYHYEVVLVPISANVLHIINHIKASYSDN